MIVTRDVILDLLPLYIAGEASAGTRVLVTEYLSRDPELAEQVRRSQAEQPESVSPSVAPDLEMKALLRTRREIGLRTWAFGLAWFFTVASLGVQASTTPDGGTRVRLAVLDYPLVFGACMVIAVVCWGAYVVLRRRTRLS